MSNMVNEKVEHVTFGFGVVKEVQDNKIMVQFQDGIGIKLFLYPDAFEKFLKAANPMLQNNLVEEYHRKQEKIKLEYQEKERIEKEHEAAEKEQKKTKLTITKKSVTSARKKKSN